MVKKKKSLDLVLKLRWALSGVNHHARNAHGEPNPGHCSLCNALCYAGKVLDEAEEVLG